MNEQETILEGYSTQEKTAYLGAIASLATADRVASREKVDHLTALAQAAELIGAPSIWREDSCYQYNFSTLV